MHMSEKEYGEIFSKNLKYYMNLNNITRSELAQELGVSFTTVSNWVKGYKLPRMDKVEKISAFFHIQKSDLLEDKEKKDESFSNSQIMTLAAHFEGDEFTAEEMKEIKNFIEFVKNRKE